MSRPTVAAAVPTAQQSDADNASVAAHVVTAVRRRADEYYLEELHGFVSTVRRSDASRRISAAVTESVSTYLGWLRWTGWNAANLAPLSPREPDSAARTLALATLVYAGGRLIDDGLDQHLTFKDHCETIVGTLSRIEPNMPLATACALSAHLGNLAVQYALGRLVHLNEITLAHSISRLIIRATAGVIWESTHPVSIEPHAYRWLAHRKAVAYNLILYLPLLPAAADPTRRLLVRGLYELDELAQLINDFRDMPDDRRSRRVNAFLDSIFATKSGKITIRRRHARFLRRIELWPLAARQAIVAMAQNLDLDAIGVTLPARRRRGRSELIKQAIDGALSGLDALQEASGGWRTAWSTTTDMRHPTVCDSPFASALILLALRNVPIDCDRSSIARCLTYLQSKRNDDGLVAFLPTGIDPDLDDTALLNWALQAYRYDAWPYRSLARRITHMPTRDGLWLTWVRPTTDEPNDIDPCVSANVLRFLGENIVATEQATAALSRVLDGNSFFDGTLYYVSPAALPYLALAQRERIRRQILPPRRAREIAESLLTQMAAGPTPSPIDLAMTVSVAARSNVDLRSLARPVEALLATRQANGAWPNDAAFRAFNYWGSSALTTAFAAEALTLYRARIG
jgi:hypothetical protein